MADLLSSAAIAQQVQTHAKTALECTEAALARAKTFQDKFHTFITLDEAGARAKAQAVDKQVAQGKRLPLAGVPIAVKDLIDVQGLPTTAGCPAYADRIAKSNATVVAKLEAAGAVTLGKLQLHECAFGFTGRNAHYGDCPNPYAPDRFAGGSSSGSAVAVALEICPLTLGSDTGGSIRLPAGQCGISGLKPTYGRVSRAGVIPLSWSLDHVGPMARTAQDLALALEVMAGRDPLDAATSRKPVGRYSQSLERDLKGLKLGIPTGWFTDDVDDCVAETHERAIKVLEGLGMKRVPVEIPLFEEILAAHRAIIFPEAGAFHKEKVLAAADKFGPDIRANLEVGVLFSAVEYVQAQRMRQVALKAWHAAWKDVDCVLSPVAPIEAPKLDAEIAIVRGQERPLVRAMLDRTIPFNLLGFPVLAFSAGISPGGLPLGLQLAAKPFAEERLFQVVHAFQQQTDWHLRPPAVTA